MTRRNNDNLISPERSREAKWFSIFQRIINVLLIIAIVILTIFFMLIGTAVGLIIGYWQNLPSLEPLEYKASDTWKFHLEIYSDLNTVTIGDTQDYVESVLKKLDYKLVNTNSPRKGEYSVHFDEAAGSGIVIIGIRSFSYPRRKEAGYLVTLNVRRSAQDDGSRIASITKEDDTPITEFHLEPKLLAELYGSEGTTRELVHLVDIPNSLQHAYIAIEDRQFKQHWGINLKRILKVAYDNIRAMKIVAGGASTITQQLARNLFDEISYEQTFSRKIKEALMAIKIEQRLSKDEILERYLNLIDLGRYGSRQLYGVQQASESYFGKSVWELSLPEFALLAVLPKSPTRYSPVKHPENAKRRRNIVLKSMLNSKFISKDEYDTAIATPLKVKEPSRKFSEAPHFIEYVKSYLEKKYKEQLYEEGLKVYTTLDIFMQEAANKAIAKGLRELDNKMQFPDYDQNAPDSPDGIDPLKYIQGALAAIEPQTGYIRAMVGGRDFYISRNKLNFFNRATQAKRQAGSTFKPFVYCAALENSQITPATIINDKPWFINTPQGRWAPENYRKDYYGNVTLRTALIKSLNVATAKLMNEGKYNVGIAKTVNMAERMGIRSRLQPYPSLALGTSDVSLLEITSAYGVWANRGIRAKPISILFVEDRDGRIIEENTPLRKRVIDENLAYLMTYLMQGALDTNTPGWRGTGWRVRKPPFNFFLPAAGKTGTTSDYVDAWFAGYIPQLVAGVWLGFDGQKNIMEDKSDFKRAGATAALPIWAYFMKRAAYHKVKGFAVPPRICEVEIDKRTGMRSNYCPTEDIITEAFIKGTEPTKLCTEHPSGWKAEVPYE